MLASSVFDELRGIGPARKRALLQHFGSPERFLAASREELEAVPGLSLASWRAKSNEQLHRTGLMADDVDLVVITGTRGPASRRRSPPSRTAATSASTTCRRG
jgi:hypothetical protein